MQRHRFSAPTELAPEERAFLLRLTALNAAFEAARAGETGRPMAARADAIDEMLTHYFLALTKPDAAPQ